MSSNLLYKGIASLIVITIFSSCVTHRKYEALENKYNALIESNDSCRSELALTTEDLNSIEQKANELYAANTKLRADFTETEAMYNKVKLSYEQLGENYRKLIASKSEDLARLDSELKEMESKLSNKDDDLSNREAELMKQKTKLDKMATDVEELRIDLEQREKRINELQDLVRQKDKTFKELSQKIKDAINVADNKGFTVTQKDGRIYVSVESQLLFKPGRTDIDSKGEEALLNLAVALADLEDIEIIVEGHTDKQPIKTARFADNWDLSVLRATSVVRLMTGKGKLSSDIIVPAGRAQFHPVDNGSSAEALAKNRRIEIIISPNLSEVYKLIQD